MKEPDHLSGIELQPVSMALPALIEHAGGHARDRFIEFFAAEIRNPGTRAVYAQSVRQFLEWCYSINVELEAITPVVVASYIELMTTRRSSPTVKRHLSAIRRLFDFLVIGHVIPTNPASSVRGPKHVVKKGKTPVLLAEEARELLDSIDTTSIVGLRDRALIGVMVFSFARVSAVVQMNVDDYFLEGRRMKFRLHEKGGKPHDVPAHHNAEEYVDTYLDRTGILEHSHSPLFRTVDRHRRLTDNRLHRVDVLRMIKRRVRKIGLSEKSCCHTFRATGITAYLKNGGLLEHAQQIAAHDSVRTTKLYDRRSDDITLDEIEKIQI